MSRTNETRPKNGMKLVSVNLDQMQVFVIIIHKDEIMINTDVNEKN